jgi:fluoride exporter
MRHGRRLSMGWPPVYARETRGVRAPARARRSARRVQELQEREVTLSRFVMIAVGGSLGALARYGLSFWVQERAPGAAFPYGTFVVNITGCLVMGIVMTRLNEGGYAHVNWRFLVPVGFIGAYTTFSSFVFETFRLIEQGMPLIGFGYVASSLILGYLALWIGVVVTRAFL